MLALINLRTTHIIEEFQDLGSLTKYLEEMYFTINGETREEFGISCADDFAGDNDMTTQEYIEEYGNPSDDDAWWCEIVAQHLDAAIGNWEPSIGTFTIKNMWV